MTEEARKGEGKELKKPKENKKIEKTERSDRRVWFFGLY